MLRKNPKKDRQDDLFRPRLENIIDPRHELAKLAALIDWNACWRRRLKSVCKLVSYQSGILPE